ncbi:Iron-enterobactin transporter ATP-binding protein OS=Streptomyces microflavus OX=1919 GN=Smic_75560 PE=4 SV=1 [Streptomyces microflavus]
MSGSGSGWPWRWLRTPPSLFLDEPTTYLDLRHQLEVLQTVVRLRAERRLTVVMVLHDLNHAARFADRIVALREGPRRGGRALRARSVTGCCWPKSWAWGPGGDPTAEGGWPVCYPDHPLEPLQLLRNENHIH